MGANISIRTERMEDHPVVASIVERAFADVPYSDHREHLMVDRLRDTDAFIASLSLVAVLDGEPVGHILLTKAKIQNEPKSTETLALAPLSVVPEYQKRGGGRSLVEAAHRRAAALGFGSIVLVGIPNYYGRFGYEPLDRYPIALPFSARVEHCFIIPLRPRALVGVSGTVEYGVGWLDH